MDIPVIAPPASQRKEPERLCLDAIISKLRTGRLWFVQLKDEICGPPDAAGLK